MAREAAVAARAGFPAQCSFKIGSVLSAIMIARGDTLMRRSHEKRESASHPMKRLMNDAHERLCASGDNLLRCDA